MILKMYTGPLTTEYDSIICGRPGNHPWMRYYVLGRSVIVYTWGNKYLVDMTVDKGGFETNTVVEVDEFNAAELEPIMAALVIGET